MENRVLPVTALGRNGTACPHCCHQHLEKVPMVYKRKMSHTLSLQCCNTSTLHIHGLHIHICVCGGSLVLEQARRASGVPRSLRHESARWAAHQRNGAPPYPAATCQKPPGQHTSRPTVAWEWGEESQLLLMPPLTHQSLLLSLQWAAAGGETAHPLFCCLASQQRPQVPLTAKYT